MKKAFALVLCLVLTGMLAVNGTFAAEFTQAVSEAVNTLFKAVEGLAANINPNPTTDPSTFRVELVYPDGGTGMTLLTPGTTTARKVAVANQSNGKAAYFRIAFAVQADVREHLILDFNDDASSPYIWSDWRESLTIDGRKFDVIIGTYTENLAVGETSPAALWSVKLANITSQQMNTFDEDFLQIRVLAICADDFGGSAYTTAQAALDQALPIDSPEFNPFE